MPNMPFKLAGEPVNIEWNDSVYLQKIDLQAPRLTGFPDVKLFTFSTMASASIP
jgi:hypothetical protein